ncbi:MAG: transposase [Pleurocapsa sp. MO_226.B13]|nr:transposase [Pleurocapsa sp. MO_226.B13]
MTNIIGLDVGRGSAVLCCLSELPNNIQQHYRKLRNESKFYQIDCDRAGVEQLLSLQPDGIVLEPSGHWYSHFWVTVAKAKGIPIYWVGHTDLKGQRSHFGFTNKRDEEDALCLAACYFDSSFIDIHGRKRFLNYYQDELISRVRELFHEKEQLQKLRTNLITQLRQRLSFEFPEAANQTMTCSPITGVTPFIHWLALKTQVARYDNKYNQSIALELGINITEYTRAHSLIIIDIEKRITENCSLLKKATENGQFEQYNRVFNKFGFGVTIRSLLLYHVYPIDKFLIGGKPWIEYERSRKKLQKRDRSLRKFQAFLGLSFSYEISGNSRKRKFHGSSLVRAHLYIWAVCMVARKKNVIGSQIGQQLCNRYQELRQNFTGKDSLNRILFKMTRMLFYELVNEIYGKKS